MNPLPYAGDPMLQAWADSLAPYQGLIQMEIQIGERAVTMHTGDTARGTYEALTFTRELNGYSFGYLAMPAVARRTVTMLSGKRNGIRQHLDEALRENAGLDDPVPLVGYGKVGSAEELHTDIVRLTDAILHKMLN